eukprot:TRINITY_DN27544_c0_g1_i1.p1 TRINITY_DN27544_c0_g1~~TRINITY_DN27544_c0_g1_i1.p1  ORF type:complete len:466 (-),score=43.09 TRINITY_DN27544_c0_g1_i1:622-2019(-)
MSVSRIICIHAGFASLTGFLIGYSLCFIGALLVDIQRALELCFPCQGGISNDALAECSCFEKRFAVSCVSITAIVGGLLGGFTSDVIGRRRTLMFLDVLFISGAFAMALSAPGTKVLFFAGRMLSGLAVGGGCVASSYIAEISPGHIRGMLVELNELFLGLGCVTAALVGYCLGDANWRITVGLLILPAMLQLFALTVFLEESPSWLLLHGYSHEAVKASRVLNIDLPGDVTDVECSSEEEERRRIKEIPKKAKSRALLLALGCGFFHAITGTNTMLYYSRNILQRIGLHMPLLGTLSVDVMKLCGILVCVFAVERCGRRKLLIVGTSGIICGHLGLALAFKADLDLFALVSLIVLIFFWNISWSGLMLVVASEVLPATWRGIGLGAVYSLYWAISGLEEQTLNRLLEALTTSGTFLFYGVWSMTTLIFVIFYLPETGHRKLGLGAQESSSDAEATEEESVAESS